MTKILEAEKSISPAAATEQASASSTKLGGQRAVAETQREIGRQAPATGKLSNPHEVNESAANAEGAPYYSKVVTIVVDAHEPISLLRKDKAGNYIHDVSGSLSDADPRKSGCLAGEGPESRIQVSTRHDGKLEYTIGFWRKGVSQATGDYDLEIQTGSGKNYSIANNEIMKSHDAPVVIAHEAPVVKASVTAPVRSTAPAAENKNPAPTTSVTQGNGSAKTDTKTVWSSLADRAMTAGAGLAEAGIQKIEATTRYVKEMKISPDAPVVPKTPASSTENTKTANPLPAEPVKTAAEKEKTGPSQVLEHKQSVDGRTFVQAEKGSAVYKVLEGEGVGQSFVLCSAGTNGTASGFARTTDRPIHQSHASPVSHGKFLAAVEEVKGAIVVKKDGAEYCLQGTHYVSYPSKSAKTQTEPVILDSTGRRVILDQSKKLTTEIPKGARTIDLGEDCRMKGDLEVATLTPLGSYQEISEGVLKNQHAVREVALGRTSSLEAKDLRKKDGAYTSDQDSDVTFAARNTGVSRSNLGKPVLVPLSGNMADITCFAGVTVPKELMPGAIKDEQIFFNPRTGDFENNAGRSFAGRAGITARQVTYNGTPCVEFYFRKPGDYVVGERSEHHDAMVPLQVVDPTGQMKAPERVKRAAPTFAGINPGWKDPNALYWKDGHGAWQSISLRGLDAGVSRTAHGIEVTRNADNTFDIRIEPGMSANDFWWLQGYAGDQNNFWNAGLAGLSYPVAGGIYVNR